MESEDQRKTDSMKTNRRTLATLPDDQRRVLEAMDISTWDVFHNIVLWGGLTRKRTLNALRGLQRRGLVHTRRVDVHFWTEWAITDAADELLAEAEAAKR